MNSRMKTCWMLSVIAFGYFPVGCRLSDMGGAMGAPFVPISGPAGKSVSYFYRKPSMIGAGAAFALKVDEAEVTEVTNGGYYAYIAEPGEHVIYLKRLLAPSLMSAVSEAAGYEKSGAFTTKAGGVLYLRYKLNSLSGVAGFVEVPGDEAIRELETLKRFNDGVRKGLVP